MKNRKYGLSEKKSAETKAKKYRNKELLFREYSLENVSLNFIINQAVVPRGSFNSYFDSKDFK